MKPLWVTIILIQYFLYVYTKSTLGPFLNLHNHTHNSNLHKFAIQTRNTSTWSLGPFSFRCFFWGQCPSGGSSSRCVQCDSFFVQKFGEIEGSKELGSGWLGLTGVANHQGPLVFGGTEVVEIICYCLQEWHGIENFILLHFSSWNIWSCPQIAESFLKTWSCLG